MSKTTFISDDYYAEQLTLRTRPAAAFLRGDPPAWPILGPLCISSVEEDRMLSALGLNRVERNRIEGLLVARSSVDSAGLSLMMRQGASSNQGAEGQNTSLLRLAADPPREVGWMQRKTARGLLRPFPSGLRFSGNNMSPLPPWLGGAQHVCLNFSNCDLAVQMHFALFKHSSGYVLKPREMRTVREVDVSLTRGTPGIDDESKRGLSFPSTVGAQGRSSVRAGEATPNTGLGLLRLSAAKPIPRWVCDVEDQRPSCFRPRSGSADQLPSTPRGKRQSKRLVDRLQTDGQDHPSQHDPYWPPPRENLHRTSIEVLSLHNLPKRREVRPRLDGSRGMCHCFHPELSGGNAPPDKLDASWPSLSISLHPIGGFCAVSSTLPLPQTVQTEFFAAADDANGMNTSFNSIVHCVAAEPHAVFLRVGVSDGGLEVAFEIVVLGRLRTGYRVLQLRSPLGTRIELCRIFVHVKTKNDSEINLWQTPRQLRQRRKTIQSNDDEVGEVMAENSALRQQIDFLAEAAVSQRCKMVVDMCDSMKNELALQVKKSEWAKLIDLRPRAATTAVEQFESQLGGLTSHVAEWYDEDAQLMSALTMAVDAKTAVSSWPRSLELLKAFCGMSSLAEAFGAEAMTVQPQRDEEPIGPEGAYGTCALLVLGSKLQELNLPGCRLGATGAEALSHALRRNTTLRVLCLAGSRYAPNITTAGAVHICAALEINSTLTKLSLAENLLNGADREFKTALHRALQSNRYLEDMDLRFNRSLGLAGADAVIDAKAPLHRLNLLNTVMGVSKARQLAMLNVETLCGLRGDEQEFLASNMALDSGDAVLLTTELSRNGSRLTMIDLTRNQLKDDALEELKSLIHRSKNLHTLRVGGNLFSEAAQQELQDATRLSDISLTVDATSRNSTL